MAVRGGRVACWAVIIDNDRMPHVLCIEDEASIRKFLRVTLTSHGFTLAEATTGAEGIQLAARQPPDVVILDLGLPDMDGVQGNG